VKEITKASHPELFALLAELADCQKARKVVIVGKKGKAKKQARIGFRQESK